jgi:hypothetical protein
MLIEGQVYHYWLIVDIALDKSLSSVDSFLRKIWLECCGHMSGFELERGGTIGKNNKVDVFAPGERIYHVYDFGTTTVSRITFMAETVRPKQRNAVRLLARNIPPVFECKGCGSSAAEYTCIECGGMYDMAVFCKECAKKHEKKNKHYVEDMLPIVNSPRCGECGYCGEDSDAFVFRPCP